MLNLKCLYLEIRIFLCSVRLLHQTKYLNAAGNGSEEKHIGRMPANDDNLPAYKSITANSKINQSFDTTERVSLDNVKKILTEGGYRIQDGFTCIQTTCLSCNEKKGTVCINKVTGFFLCLDCMCCGSWNDFEAQSCASSDKTKHSNQLNKKYTLKDRNYISEANKKWELLMQSSKGSFVRDEVHSTLPIFDLINYLSDDLIKELHAYVDKDSVCVPLKNAGKYVVGYKQLSASGDEVTVPASQCPGIVKYVPIKVKKKSENAVIVSTVKDLIALSRSKLQFHIICLPHGVLYLPQEILPLLEQYKKLVLWFGADAVSLGSVRAFSKKLGEERCYFIRTDGEHYDAYTAFKKGVDLDSVIKSASPIYHKRVTTFASFRQTVLSELQNKSKSDGVKWKRFPKLNEYLMGHRRGELTVLTGPTGCGKTTFISEYSLDLALQGVNTLWGSFEIRNERLARIMLQQMVEIPLDKNLDKFEMWADKFQMLPIYFMTFHGAQPINTVMETIKHCAYVYDIAHVVIDNLQFMMGLSSSDVKFVDKFYKQDLIIQECRSFATRYNCHVTLVIHPRKEHQDDALTVNSIFGGVKASQEADNILIIQSKMLQSLQIKKFLQVAKNRYSGDLGIMPLVFHKESLSFTQRSSINNSKENQSPHARNMHMKTDFSTTPAISSLTQEIANENLKVP